MRILLVKPKFFVHGGVYRYLEDVKFTPLHIAIIAALSDGHDVTLCDNDYENIPYEKSFDLVGITTTTFTSHLAYEIADKFRAKGVKVVLGGVHASLMPDECLLHADAAVVGEAEYIWKDVLRDLENGAMKKIYTAPRPTEMNDVPFPRRDLLHEDYWVANVQTSRGCPNRCKFCYLPSVPWAKHRIRDISLVYEELKNLRQRIVYFVDDNMFADEEYVIRLCKKIAPLGLTWSIQAPTNIAKNRRLLSAMADAGCFHVQVGFQTVNPGSLQSAGIAQNKIENYREVVRSFHRHKILVLGFFMFGFDHDDAGIFPHTVETIKKMDLDDVCLYILTPYPGTDMYEKFKSEGRLISDDRSKYGWSNAVYMPKHMAPEELDAGVQWMYGKLYPHFKQRSWGKIASRFGLFLRRPRLFEIIAKALYRKIKIAD